MIPRRSILSSTGSALLVGSSGCLSSPDGTTGADNEGRSNENSDDEASSDVDESLDREESAEEEAGSDCDPESELHPGQRGKAEATVHASATPEDDDEVEYVGDGTIRIVTGRRGEEVTSTETMPFVEWAEIWCARIAADAVFDYLEEQLASTRGIGTDYETCLITARHKTEYDADGEVYSEPDIDVDQLVAATPRTASATVEAAEHEYTRDLPVYVERVTFRTGNED